MGEGGARPWLRTSPGWSTPLGRWMDSIGGVGPLREQLAAKGCPTSPFTPYKWLEGRHPPSDFYAIAMIEISEGRLTFQDIYGHRAALGKMPHPKGLVPRAEG